MWQLPPKEVSFVLHQYHWIWPLIVQFTHLNYIKLTNFICRITSIKAFGWDVQKVNGHDLDELNEAFDLISSSTDFPHCIVCDTVKGKGIVEMEENMFAWHHGAPSLEKYIEFREELNA